MLGFRRIRVLPTALLALLLVSLPPAAVANDEVNFNFYPTGAQNCLYAAAEASKCKSQTMGETNSCFCRNGGNFVTNAAKCIGKSSRSDLQKVYSVMRDACSVSKTPLSVTEDEFMDAANGGTTTTSARPSTTGATDSKTSATDSTTINTATATTTTTTPAGTSPAGDNKDEKKGMSTGAVAGIAVGVSIAGVAFLAALAWFLVRRRKRVGEESHPMLPQQSHLGVTPGPVHDSMRFSTAYYGASPPDTGGWPSNKEWVASPDPSVAGANYPFSNRSSMFTWESPAHLGMIAPSPPLPQMPIQELDGAQHFPTGTAQAPAEMGGTPVVATPPSQPVAPPTGLGVGGGGVQFRAYQPALQGQQQLYTGQQAWQQR
ncbi:hypothetical protein VTI74DRAFT_3587 [Chaetomium olivicolor]